jgi:hypothetical protein
MPFEQPTPKHPFYHPSFTPYSYFYRPATLRQVALRYAGGESGRRSKARPRESRETFTNADERGRLARGEGIRGSG